MLCSFANKRFTLEDRRRTWKNDEKARAIFAYLKEKADGHPILPRYAVSDAPAHTMQRGAFAACVLNSNR